MEELGHITVCMVKVSLPEDWEEVLVMNLPTGTFDCRQIVELYHIRWGGKKDISFRNALDPFCIQIHYLFTDGSLAGQFLFDFLIRGVIERFSHIVINKAGLGRVTVPAGMKYRFVFLHHFLCPRHDHGIVCRRIITEQIRQAAERLRPVLVPDLYLSIEKSECFHFLPA